MEQQLRPALIDFHGVSMSKFFTDNWDEIQNFQARPDDVVIATYPKAGTTWVSHVLDLLYFGQMSPERQKTIPIYERVPFLEFSVPPYPKGTALADQLTISPRLIKTHLPVQFLPKSFWEKNSKIVCVVRNAKDCAVSYYHFHRMNVIQPEPGDWCTFLKAFMDGKVVFGSWYDHVNGWWEKKETYSNLKVVFYEDLIENNCWKRELEIVECVQDSGRELDHLCSFLGLSPSPEERESVLAKMSFENMKKDKMANYSTLSAMDQKVSPFMRKGKVGDWKNHFTVAQNEVFDEDYVKKMKNSTVKFRTEI